MGNKRVKPRQFSNGRVPRKVKPMNGDNAARKRRLHELESEEDGDFLGAEVDNWDEEDGEEEDGVEDEDEGEDEEDEG